MELFPEVNFLRKIEGVAGRRRCQMQSRKSERDTATGTLKERNHNRNAKPKPTSTVYFLISQTFSTESRSKSGVHRLCVAIHEVRFGPGANPGTHI